MTWNADYQVMTLSADDLYVGPRQSEWTHNYYRQLSSYMLSDEKYETFVFSSRSIVRTK